MCIVVLVQSALITTYSEDSGSGMTGYAEKSYIIDFKSAIDMENNIFSYGKATSAEFDVQEESMHIHPVTETGDGTIANGQNPSAFFIDLSSVNLRADIYRYIALKIKTNDKTSVFGRASACTDVSLAYRAQYGGNTYVIDIPGQYNGSEDWQIVVLDIRTAATTYGDKNPDVSWIDGAFWQKICFDLLPYNYYSWRDTEEFWVECVGFFSIVGDIEEHFGVSVEVPGEAVESNASSFVMNLDSPYGVSRNIVGYGAATSASFAMSEKALELTPKPQSTTTDNPLQSPSTFFLDISSYGVSSEHFPLIVLKVKIKDKMSVFGNISASTDGSLAYREQYGGNVYSMQMSSLYSPNEEWQLMVMDINDSAQTYGSKNPDIAWINGCIYAKIAVNLLKYNYYDYRETEGFYVKSIGFFSDKDAVRDYYGLDKNSLPESVECTETSYVFDLTSAQNIGRNISGFGNAATGFVDEEAKALYVAPKVSEGDGTDKYGKNPAAFMMNVGQYNIDAGEYPLFAMKVKLKNPESIFGRVAASTTGTLAYKELYGGVTYMIDTTNNGYEKIDDWQIVVVDIWNSKQSMGPKDLTLSWIEGTEWRQLVIDLIPFNYYYWTESEGFWIEWAGFFATRADIIEYCQTVE